MKYSPKVSIAATVATLTFVFAPMLASCGGSSGPASSLTADLTDFVVKTETTVLKAGEVTITANNIGNETHELVLFKTDLDADKLPVDEEGAVDEAGAGLTLVNEAEGIKPGKNKSFTATVTPGKYLLVCNTIENGKKHYMLGMYLPITVE
jgi:uncharacterized cupredoxin-like copper-binding protein